MSIQISEWDWFCLQLRVLSRQQYHHPDEFSVRYAFRDAVDYLVGEPELPIVCRITARVLEGEEARQQSPSQRMEWIGTWVDTERRLMRELLSGLPQLRDELDLERDLLFEIGYSYGMGWTLVCSIRGSEVTWSEGRR